MSLVASSSETVFAIPELLETILLQLDLRTLLTTAPLVCRTWTNLIKESHRVQQALFLSPAWTSGKMYNPLLADAFPSFFPGPEGSSTKDDPFTLTTLDMATSPEKKRAYLRKEASWRRMLVQQPPVSNFAYMRIRSAMGGQSYSQYKIKDKKKDTHSERGIRMQLLFEWVLFNQQHIRFRDTSASWLLWSEYSQIEVPKTRRNPDLRVAFERLIAQYQIIVYERVMVKCVRGHPEPVSEDVMLRQELRESYETDVAEDGYSFEEVDIKESILKD